MHELLNFRHMCSCLAHATFTIGSRQIFAGACVEINPFQLIGQTGRGHTVGGFWEATWASGRLWGGLGKALGRLRGGIREGPQDASGRLQGGFGLGKASGKLGEGFAEALRRLRGGLPKALVLEAPQSCHRALGRL